MRNMKIVFFLGFLFSTSSLCLSKDLQGVVRAISGKPVEGVTLHCYSSKEKWEDDMRPSTSTDNQGRFSFKANGKILFVSHKDYIPVIKVLDGKTLQLQITLTPFLSGGRDISVCGEKTTTEIGGIFSFQAPAGVTLIERQDSDALFTWLSVGAEEMRFIFGRHSTSGFPPEELILNSKTYQIETFKKNIWSGVELRGELNDGKLWRFIGIPSIGEALYKNVATKEAAGVFNKVIDSMCVRLSALRR